MIYSASYALVIGPAAALVVIGAASLAVVCICYKRGSKRDG